MTKKDQARMEALENEVRLMRALRWSDPVEPDVAPPETFTRGLSKGFLFNKYSTRIEKACSSSIGHNFGDDEKTSTQGPRALFSSKALALRAMRYEVAMDSATTLAAIDKAIEEAEKL